VLLLGKERSLKETLGALFRNRWSTYLVYLLPILLFLLLRTLLLGRPLPTFDVHFVDNPLGGMSPLLRPLGAVAVFGKVLVLMIFPLDLSADYGFNQIPVDRFYAMGTFYFGLISLAAVTTFCSLRRKTQPFIFFGWILFILTYLPVSNIFFLIHTILGERILYIPSMGFCIFLASVLYALASSKRAFASIAAFSSMGALLLFNGTRTHIRNADWKDDLTLFESTAKVSGDSVRVLNNYGNVLLLRGDLEGAEARYRRALQLFPAYDDAAVNLSGVLIRQGKPDEAVGILKEVLRRRPDHEAARTNMDLASKLSR
jgi:tetratricopeptide (TPR) repeat protein